MKKLLSFDDVLITPKFSYKRTRKDITEDPNGVDLRQNFLGIPLKSPIISANMDTVTGVQMAKEMAVYGAVGALHRFSTIEENVSMFDEARDGIFNNKTPAAHSYIIGSVGIGEKELERAKALVKAGCKHILIDVAHGAAIHVVEQYDSLRSTLDSSVYIIVGNFATADGIKQFCWNSKSERKPDAFKVGVGGGSNCSTRVVTGCGWPTLASILDCSSTGFPLIADGGIRNSGDIAKSLSAGASVVMLGSLLAGTEETPGESYVKYGDDFAKVVSESEAKLDLGINFDIFNGQVYRHYEDLKICNTEITHKKYRGSASQESYGVQGKTASHRAPEGVSRMVEYKGPVKDILQTLDGGLRSNMTYLNSTTLSEIKENAELCEISNAGMAESKPHGLKG